MKSVTSLCVLSCLFGFTTLLPANDLEALRIRSAEQERQIKQLEVENARLRELLSETNKSGSSSVIASGESAKSGAQTTPTNVTAEARIHLVKKGDTLSHIARQYKVSSAALLKENNLKPDSILHINQKIKVPGVAGSTVVKTEAPTADESKTVTRIHTVKAGDTFYKIAAKYGVTVNALSSANANVRPEALQIGQKLKILTREKVTTAPTPTQNPGAQANQVTPKTVGVPAPEKEFIPQPGSGTPVKAISKNPQKIYRVRIVERITYGEFAKKYNTTTDRLNALNGINIRPDQTLAEGSYLYVSAQPME